MVLDAEPPSPPSLAVEDAEEYEIDRYQHEKLAEYLEQGAWEEGFSEWMPGTDLTATEYAIVRDLDLVDDFEFIWNDDIDEVDHLAPTIPEDWTDRKVHPDLDSTVTVDLIETELDDLGEIVADVLTDYYVDWEDEQDVFGPQFNAQDDSLSEAEYSDRDEFFE
ncbi:hypothetical protein [Natronorubrum halophilum]|uniref:hypothetical protein n=1 Tax=Natronorubrum halophilum TaxID=1702106 RepID=UPI0010C1EB01|nr:hypothetical protein [Natronorubrum halophilum]